MTLRFGSASDTARIALLAALDDTTPPPLPLLLAEVDGELRAALALSNGTVIADPFYPTLDLIDLLRARARQLEGDGGRRRSRRWHAGPLLRTAARS